MPVQYARLLYLGAALCYWRDHPTQAMIYAIQAEKIARELNDKKLLANILYYAGEMHRETKNYTKAQALLEETISLCRETGHYARLSLSLTSSSIIYYNLNDKKQASLKIKEGMEIAVREKILWGQSYALRVKANMLRLDGKFKESLSAYELALKLSNDIDDRISAGIALANMATLTSVLDDHPSSMQYAKRAFIIFQSIGNEYQLPYPVRMMAYAALNMKDLAQARIYCLESMNLNYKMGKGHEIGVTGSIIALAEIELHNKNHDKAIQLLSTAERFIKEYSFKFQEADTRSLERVKKVLKAKMTPQKTKALLKEWQDLSISEVVQKISMIEEK
jgi:tetratricopeptide (TPR) repeat protein